MDSNIGTDLRDIEKKLGRKTPDCLFRSVTDGKFKDNSYGNRLESPIKCNSDSFQNKLRLLRQEMAHLRGTDVKLMRQLLSINEGIESTRWAMEERGLTVAVSRESSLTGSLCSLAESLDASRRSSVSSLQYGSDTLDAVSVGSYLDTLTEDTTPPRTFT